MSPSMTTLALVSVADAPTRKGVGRDFLRRRWRTTAELGVTVKRLLTDNGSAYRSKASGLQRARPWASLSTPGPIGLPTNGKR